jgi:hypothetical protein
MSEADARVPDANEPVIPAMPPNTRSAQFEGQLCVRQFGILHILILTAVTAALLKVRLALWGDSWPDDAHRWLEMSFRSLWAIVFAASLVGSSVLVRAKCYPMFSRLQPGHWIILITAASGLLWGVIWAIYYRLVCHDGDLIQWGFLVSTTLFDLLTAIAWLYAAKRLLNGRGWRILFGALALGSVAAAATAVLTMVALTFYAWNVGYTLERAIFNASRPWAVVRLVVLLAAVVLDIPRRASRDWLHWLGVCTVGLDSLMMTVW